MPRGRFDDVVDFQRDGFGAGAGGFVSMSAFAAMSFDEASSVMHPSPTPLIRLGPEIREDRHRCRAFMSSTHHVKRRCRQRRGSAVKKAGMCVIVSITIPQTFRHSTAPKLLALSQPVGLSDLMSPGSFPLGTCSWLWTLSADPVLLLYYSRP